MPHVLQSSSIRTMSQADIWEKSETDCYEWFKRFRWPETDGRPVCPHCSGTQKVYAFKTRPIFKCGPCERQFSATTGTPFAGRKISYKKLLAGIFCFVGGRRGVPALRLSSEIGVSYNTAILLTHKAREAMGAEQAGRLLTGKVEVDGTQYGMTRRSPNMHRGWRKGHNTAKQCIIVMRERKGRTLTFVTATEAEGVPLLFKHIDPAAHVYLDQGAHWPRAKLQAHFAKVQYVNHSEQRMEVPGIHTNSAESLNDRIRHIERTHTRISGQYLDLYAAEAAWRRDHREQSNGKLFESLLKMISSTPQSKRFANHRRVPKPKAAPPHTPRKSRAY